MTSFNENRPRKDIAYSGDANPTTSTPGEVKELYQNKISGEKFTCIGSALVPDEPVYAEGYIPDYYWRDMGISGASSSTPTDAWEKYKIWRESGVGPITLQSASLGNGDIDWVFYYRIDANGTASYSKTFRKTSCAGSTTGVCEIPYLPTTYTYITEWIGTLNTHIQQDPILNSAQPDLVVMFTMDNIIGSTLVDETGNGNDATIEGTPISTTGVIGDGYSFPDAASRARTARIVAASATQGCLSYWYRGDDQSANGHRPFKLWGDSSNYLGGYHNPTSFHFYVTNGGIVRDATFSFTRGSGYNHYIMQSDGVTNSFYVNGVPITPTWATGSNTGAWWAAGGNGLTDAYLSLAEYGTATSVDQARYFNRALTQEEITALYNEGIPQ